PSAFVETGDGLLWATTSYGGAFAGGTIFAFDPVARAVVFKHSLEPAEGTYPLFPLVAGTDGGLYGTTYLSGTNGLGTFFRLGPSGSFEVLHDFTEEDGRGLWNLIQADDGNFYGVNEYWIVRIDTAGNVTHLRALNSPLWSRNHLMQASDGKLYVSEQGGGPQQHGAISRMRLDGSDFTTLHIFSWLDGASPG